VSGPSFENRPAKERDKMYRSISTIIALTLLATPAVKAESGLDCNEQTEYAKIQFQKAKDGTSTDFAALEEVQVAFATCLAKANEESKDVSGLLVQASWVCRQASLKVSSPKLFKANCLLKAIDWADASYPPRK
jgi:hypothetical protein